MHTLLGGGKQLLLSLMWHRQVLANNQIKEKHNACNSGLRLGEEEPRHIRCYSAKVP